MNRFFSNLLMGKNNLLSGLIALAIVASIALGCNCGKTFDTSNSSSNSNTSSDAPFGDDSAGEMPGKDLLNAMIKETTADFAYAISTEDFSKIYSKASTDFQSTYTESQMKDVFSTVLKNKSRVLPILSKTVSMEPTFSPEPYLRTEQGLNILVANGKYATKPVPMNFEYEYVKRGGTWKMLKLVIKLQ
jgi:hypothetical protein